jgi:hypothetical protein
LEPEKDDVQVAFPFLFFYLLINFVYIGLMTMTTTSNPSIPSLSLLASMLLWKKRKMMCKLPFLCFFLFAYITFLVFCSLEITPPPTPSPVKAAGKKHAIADNESDDDNVFVPRYDKLPVFYIQNIDCSDIFT